MQASAARLLKAFGRSIRSFRKQRKLNQVDLAEASKLSRNYISDIERGVRNPSLLALIGISRALHLPLRDLLQVVEPKEQYLVPNPRNSI
jgi:transcriptional regulator with XRE-family HTH domain